MEAFEIQDESEVMSYYRLREQLSNLSQEFQSWLVKPQYLVPFLQAGNFFKLIFQKKFLCEINCLNFQDGWYASSTKTKILGMELFSVLRKKPSRVKIL